MAARPRSWISARNRTTRAPATTMPVSPTRSFPEALQRGESGDREGGPPVDGAGAWGGSAWATAGDGGGEGAARRRVLERAEPRFIRCPRRRPQPAPPLHHTGAPAGSGRRLRGGRPRGPPGPRPPPP